MTTENTDTTTDVTATVKKPCKPRSPNKPKTVDKLAVIASRKVDKLNDKRQKALKEAAERVNNRYDNKRQEDLDKAAARVNARFDDKLAELLTGLDDAVRPLVTGPGVTSVAADDAVDDTVQEAAAE